MEIHVQVALPNSKIPVFSYHLHGGKIKHLGRMLIGLVPHIAVDMSFNEYTSNQDPVLNAALSFSDDDFILDPMQYMTDLFLAGETEKLIQDVTKMIKDSRYQFFDFESEINKAGYNSMRIGQIQQTIGIFSLNTQLFPDSVNVWDSLAEGYYKAGNNEKAIEYYKKVLSMNPDEPTAKNAKETLDELQR